MEIKTTEEIIIDVNLVEKYKKRDLPLLDIKDNNKKWVAVDDIRKWLYREVHRGAPIQIIQEFEKNVE